MLDYHLTIGHQLILFYNDKVFAAYRTLCVRACAISW
jgi:hypothetical protein